MAGVGMILSDLLKAGALGKAGSTHLQGKSGVLEARVIRLLSASKAELLIQGRKVTAELGDEVQIKKGDFLQLQQEEKGALSITQVKADLPRGAQDPNPGIDNPPRLISSENLSPSGMKEGTWGTLRETLNFFVKAPNSPINALVTLAKHLDASRWALPPGSDLSSHPKISTNELQNSFIESMHQVALKSDQADLNLIPRLLEQGGMLLEKKLANLKSDPSIPIFPSEKGRFLDPKENLEWDLKSIAMKLIEQDPDHESHRADNPVKGDPIKSDGGKTDTVNVDGPKTDLAKGEPGNVDGTKADAVKGESGNTEPFKGFLQTLEKVQLLNSHLSDSGKYLVPLPIFSGGQFSFGQLYFDMGGKEDGDGEGKRSTSQRILNVSLFLDMSALGPIRADFSMLDNYISGVFQVTDPEVSDLFHRMLPELTKNLQRHDYQIKGISCKLVPPKNLNEHTLINDLIQDQSISTDGSLNVII